MNHSRVIILAAGEGSRMRSQKPKVLHEVCGETILDYVIAVSKASGISEIGVIIGFQSERVKASLSPEIATYFQQEQLGTGHAVIQALPFLKNCREI